jgi:hypothetical protein
MASPLSTGSKISGKLERMSDCSFESQSITHPARTYWMFIEKKNRVILGNKTSIPWSGISQYLNQALNP